MKEKLVIIALPPQGINIHIFDIDPDTNVDFEYIEKLGFDTDVCHWYFGTGVNIVNHKDEAT